MVMTGRCVGRLLLRVGMYLRRYFFMAVRPSAMHSLACRAFLRGRRFLGGFRLGLLFRLINNLGHGIFVPNDGLCRRSRYYAIPREEWTE